MMQFDKHDKLMPDRAKLLQLLLSLDTAVPTPELNNYY